MKKHALLLSLAVALCGPDLLSEKLADGPSLPDNRPLFGGDTTHGLGYNLLKNLKLKLMPNGLRAISRDSAGST
jgi:hypothetical protein